MSRTLKSNGRKPNNKSTKKDTLYKGTAVPVPTACDEGACFNLDITLNKKHVGIIRYTEKGWKINEIKSQGLANAIGSQISGWYNAQQAA